MQAPQTERMIALLDRKTRVAREIGELLWRAVAFDIVWRSAQHAMIRRQALGNQMRRDLIANTNIQVEPFPRHVDQTVEQIKTHAQLRGFVGEGGGRGGPRSCASPLPRLLTYAPETDRTSAAPLKLDLRATVQKTRRSSRFGEEVM